MRKTLLILASVASVAALFGCGDPDSAVVNERANAQASQAQQMGHSQGTPSPSQGK